MSFLHPEFLYYMLPPLFILFFILLRQKESEAHFFSKEVMDKLRVSANTLSIRARNALFFLMGFFIIIALAQPVIDDGKVLVKAKSSDIMIAFDISDSMLAEDVYPNRLNLAKQKALTLLKYSTNQRVGLMAFAKNSYLVSPLSFDTKAVSFLLTQLDTTSITEKGTDFFSILETFALSSKSKMQKYLLILSDGGDADDFSDEISFAKENNIVVFVLAIGTSKGAPIKLRDGTFIKHNGDILVSRLNENIADLAVKTGGVYIANTTSNRDIMTMLKEIKSISSTKELKSEEIHKYIPLFYYPLAMSLLLLLIATSSIGRKINNSSASGLALLFFMLASIDARAGLMDFMQLRDAKKAYEKGDYKKSASIYEEYANKSQDPHSYFNAGNAFYKQKKYKEAVKLYEKVIFQKDKYKAMKFANLGNAHAKQGKQDNLEKAKKYYEQSLKLVEDDNIKKNLEEVKKRIKKKKEEAQEGGDKEGKKEDKDGNEKMNKKDKNGDKDSKEKDKNKKDEDSSKSKDSKDKKQKSDDMKNKEEKDSQKEQNDKAKQEEREKQKLDKLEKDKDKKDDKSSGKAQNTSKSKMSDAEEAKWLNEINLQKNTYMYKLNKEKPNEARDNEKPW
ncbi:VWA domain-containing protein [Sulfurimonas sp.]|uniref:VWA domain-containing protein n=1 Tax=Sulfurimonas sp. TaxID=2022749 RepID=UPI002B4831C9|nr:VWA domain-containing protein [Sulfurimonas sp.]